MPLSKEEKRQAHILAQRHCNLIHAMEQASYRLFLASLSREAHHELHQKIMLSPYMDSEGTYVDGRRRLDQIESFIQLMESRVEYHRGRNTPEDAMWMLKAANAGAGAMNSHVEYNYTRLSGTATKMLAQLHRDLHRKLREEREAKEKMEKEKSGKQKLVKQEGSGGHIQTATENKARDNEDYSKRPVFQPSNTSRASRRPITMQDFERLSSKELLSNTFFVDDPDFPADCPEDLTAFEVVGLKETREGHFYEVLWEGLIDPMDTSLEELKQSAERGLWISRV